MVIARTETAVKCAKFTRQETSAPAPRIFSARVSASRTRVTYGAEGTLRFHGHAVFSPGRANKRTSERARDASTARNFPRNNFARCESLFADALLTL